MPYTATKYFSPRAFPYPAGFDASGGQHLVTFAATWLTAIPRRNTRSAASVRPVLK